MTVKEFLAATIDLHKYALGDCEVQANRPRIYCNDGYSVSVQASEFHYCSPRLNGNQDYESVELGFPSSEDELINEYAEEIGNYTDTVYGYVPIEVVEKLIEKHGGIDINKFRRS